MSERHGPTELSCWFSLSYASWLTLPRVLMEAMPPDWQLRMADLLIEYDAKWRPDEHLQTYVVAKKNGKFVKLPPELCNYRRPDRKYIEAKRITP